MRPFKTPDTPRNIPHRYGKVVSQYVKESLESLVFCQGCKTWQHPLGLVGETYCEKCSKKFD